MFRLGSLLVWRLEKLWKQSFSRDIAFVMKYFSSLLWWASIHFKKRNNAKKKTNPVFFLNSHVYMWTIHQCTLVQIKNHLKQLSFMADVIKTTQVFGLVPPITWLNSGKNLLLLIQSIQIISHPAKICDIIEVKWLVSLVSCSLWDKCVMQGELWINWDRPETWIRLTVWMGCSMAATERHFIDDDWSDNCISGQ